MILKDKIKKVFDNKMVESFTLEKKWLVAFTYYA
jgi:hypothetical protein